MEQTPFNPEQPYNTPETIRAINKSHMALLFVLDTSGSMASDNAINSLNEGMRRFKRDVDSKTKSILDVAVIRFNHNFEVLQNFVPVEDMQDIHLTAEGGTVYSSPIRAAIQMVLDRTKFYREMSEPYKPWILFVTDGEPEHDTEDALFAVAEEIQNMVAKHPNSLSFRPVGVGSFNTKHLAKLTTLKDKRGNPIILKMDTLDFSSFIDWTVKSMASVSSSSPGDVIKETETSGNLHYVSAGDVSG